MKKILSFLVLCVFSLQSVHAFSVISVSPQPAKPGDMVLLQGQDLGSSGTVTLNDQVLTTTMWSATQVAFTLPANASSGTLSLTDMTGNSSSLSFQVVSDSGASITSITPNIFSEGTIVTMSGVGFGVSPAANAQLCFSDTLCSAIGSLNQMVLSWSDTKVVVQVPKLNLPSSGKVMLSLFPNGTTSPVWLESPLYTFQSSKPLITSLSTLDIIPDNTILVISGANFGEKYIYGKSQICINGQCLGDAYIDQYLISWSQNEIRMKLPLTGAAGPATLTLNIWKYMDQDTALDIYFPASYSINIILPADPTIDQVSPLSVMPDQTVITIIGKGFGKAYLPGKHQVCFGESCISDKLIATYVYQWTDTQIQLRVPAFVDNYNSPQLQIRLFVPSKNIYTHLSAPVLFDVQHIPLVSQYYPTMDSGSTYTIFGKAFGDLPGSVMVGATEMKLLSWSDTKITFQTPSVGVSDALIVTTAKGGKSVGIPVSIVFYTLFSQDEYSKYQWYYEQMSMKEAWNMTTGSPSVVVAVIDSGVDTTQEDLIGNIWQNTKEIPGNGVDDDKNGYVDDVSGWDFIRNSNSMLPITTHGTMVASVIAAKKDNGIGMAGVAPGVKIMPLNVMASTTGSVKSNYIDVDASVKAIKYAVDNGAQVINMSFGGPYSSTFQSALQYAYDHNVTVVVAAGNEGIDLGTQQMSPICNDGGQNIIMGLAALTKTFVKTPFSNYGPCIDASLPGEGIVVAEYNVVGDAYSVADGTSFSAPLFSGMAALMRSYHPDWNVAEISYALLHNGYSIDATNPQYIGKLGSMPNIAKALSSQKPNVSYSYNPLSGLVIKPTNEVIVVDSPIAAPITTPDISTNTPVVSTDTTIFSDIPTTHHYASAITYLKNAQVLSGYPDGTFQAENPVNRAEFLKIILESAKVSISDSYANCFPDVHQEWYAKYVCFAKAKGIIQGYPDGYFRPANTINKVESLKVLAKAFGLSTTSRVTSFHDVDTASWYAPFVSIGETLNLLEEKSTTTFFSPSALMKRGSISEILYRYLYMKEKGYAAFHL